MRKIIVVLNANTNRKSTKKNIRFEHELVDEIERVKLKNVSFSSWVKQACREKVASETIDGDVCAQGESYSQLNVRPRASNKSETINNMSTLELIKYWDEKGLYHQQIAEKLNELGRETPNNKTWNRALVRLTLHD
ncbi:YlcI/YnfO family protein [Vibrio gallaecicus]|uniref:YlcI/YnfO family protein n=1 Tax=Vibrio gallaecicus TaxID=552386 RepID=UPI0019D0EF6B|nr:YlcI/YnfO family protein [Vibrio gallaecicus]MDN3616735.1 YlcI/YnfO family protein [Vibrio gallaecicus]